MSDLSAEIKEIEKALNNICGDWVGIGIQMNDARQALLELKRLASIGAPPGHKDLVLCKNCLHRFGNACDYANFWLKDDDFCSKGEREPK